MTQHISILIRLISARVFAFAQQRNYLLKPLVYFMVVSFLTSCAVTNNLYVYDPVPIQKDENKFYVGIGSGTEPVIDSSKVGGPVYFSNKISMAPILSVGGQVRILDNLDCRFAIHFPYIIGGIGLRAGGQYAFLPKSSKVNIAFGSDLGFAAARDSIKLFGAKVDLNPDVYNAYSADFYLPISVRWSEKSRVIITPKYTFTNFHIKYNQSEHTIRHFNPSGPGIALGLSLSHMYFEASTFSYQGIYYKNFGIVYRITDNEPAPDPAK